MVKKISLTQGKFSLVDDEDFDELNQYKWYAHKNKGGIWYVDRTIKYVDEKHKTISMHRKIMDFPSGKDIDHVNHDGLDNRKCNLRVCTRSQNKKNARLSKNNSSGLKGVHWNKRNKKWMALIAKDKKRIYLGLFDDKTEAGRVVDRKALELFGEFAILNFEPKSEER
jgi:hypothetical protein